MLNSEHLKRLFTYRLRHASSPSIRCYRHVSIGSIRAFLNYQVIKTRSFADPRYLVINHT
jgi:hypothetical protein